MEKTRAEKAGNLKEDHMRTAELRRIFCVVSMLLAALALPALVRAQQATGTITGTVKDPSGAAVAGAAVTLTDTERGTSLKAQTNADGIYSFPQLPISTYELRVEANGFQTSVRGGIALQLNQTATIDVAMAIGQVSQTLQVTESAPPLQTQTTEVGTVMEASSIANLPLETRQLQPAHAAGPRRGDHQPGLVQYGPENVQCRAAEYQRQPRTGELLSARRHGEHGIR